MFWKEAEKACFERVPTFKVLLIVSHPSCDDIAVLKREHKKDWIQFWNSSVEVGH